MKKLFLFLFILFLPSILAGVALFRFFPDDFKMLTELGKEKLVTNYPSLKKYIHVASMQPIKKIEPPPPVKEKPIVPNLHHFTNAEIYAPICGVDITEKFSELFVGCSFCPKYLSNEAKDNKLKYISEVRGIILKKEEEEALIFVHGCSQKDQNGSAVLIRKGYGGWQRISVYNGIQFDKEPLEFFDDKGSLIFVARRTTIKDKDIKNELISFQIQKNGLKQQNLFSIDMPRGLKCDDILQGALDNPLKISDSMFQSNLELIGCKESKLKGFYKVTFNLKENYFKPNNETSSLITKIEKYGE